MDAPPSQPPPPKKPISLGAYLAQQEAAAAAAEEAQKAPQSPPTKPAHRQKSETPEMQSTTTTTKQPASKKRKSPPKPTTKEPATKKRKAPPKKPSSTAAAATNKKRKPNPKPSPPSNETNKVYLIRAIEGWRSPPSDDNGEGEPKLDIPILGVFRSADRALEEAHAWLKGRWPREYEFVREEKVVTYTEQDAGEEWGWEIEMVTGRDDGIVFVSVEGWVVQ
ncbi:MAG: hypothetical protein Q9208_008719 [Pyrenodesmia sp. 3 TL-2023]